MCIAQEMISYFITLGECSKSGVDLLKLLSAVFALSQRMYWYVLKMAQPPIEWLQLQMQIVEENIAHQLQELLTTTDPANRAVIEKEKDRLEEREKKLLQLFGALQTQQAGPAGEFLAALHCPLTGGPMASFQVRFQALPSALVHTPSQWTALHS